MNSRQFLNINLGLGILTAVTNGGAAAVMFADSSQWSAAQMGEAALFACVGFALVLIGAFAITGRTLVSRALQMQALALAGLLCLLTLWGVSILVRTPDEQIATTWFVGILSGLGIYIFFLVRHSTNPVRFRSIRRLLLAAGAAAIVVDLGVFLKVGWF